MNRFLLSYDVKPTANVNNEKVRKVLVKGLLTSNCSSLNSYSDSTILFNSDLEFNDMKSIIELYSPYISYILVEIAKDEDEKFNSVEDKHESLSKNFDDLVLKIKEDIEKEK